MVKLNSVILESLISDTSFKIDIDDRVAIARRNEDECSSRRRTLQRCWDECFEIKFTVAQTYTDIFLQKPLHATSNRTKCTES